jgi:hypothetical protein
MRMLGGVVVVVVVVVVVAVLSDEYPTACEHVW